MIKTPLSLHMFLVLVLASLVKLHRGGSILVSTVLQKSVRNTGKGTLESYNAKHSLGCMDPM